MLSVYDGPGASMARLRRELIAGSLSEPLAMEALSTFRLLKPKGWLRTVTSVACSQRISVLVRSYALNLVILNSYVRAFTAILESAKLDESAFKEELIYSLRFVGDSRAEPFLIEVAKNVNLSTPTREAAIETLVGIGGRMTEAAYLDLLSDSEAGVRYWSLDGLAMIGGKNCADLIRPLLLDEGLTSDGNPVSSAAKKALASVQR